MKNQSLPVWETVRFVLNNLFSNKITYVRNAAFLQFFVSFVGFRILSTLFKGIIFLSGQSNFNFSNMKLFFSSPIIILAFIAYLFAVILFVFIEFSILTFMVYGTISNTHFSWRTSLKNAFGEVREFFSPQFIYFLLYLLTLLPLGNFGMTSFLTEQLYIPNFITEEIQKTTTGAIGSIILYIVLAYFHLRFIYAIPLQILTNHCFLENLKTSWTLTKKKLWRHIGIFLLVEAIISLIGFLVTFILTITLGYLSSIMDNVFIVTSLFVLSKLVIFFIAIYTKISLVIILVKLADDQDAVDVTIKHHIPEIPFKSTIITVAAFIGLTIFYSSEAITKYHWENSSSAAIVAHRGFTEYGVENSLEALEAAAKEGADYVEMDILLTKDNRFIVMHDYNLKRLARLNKKVKDMTYDELVGLPIYQNGYESHIPSFEEFVAKAKELNVKLLVELKPHGFEGANYTDLFIAKMRELGVDQTYKVMSINLNVIEEIERKAPEMDTGYVIPLQFGGFGNPAVDFYVVEDFSYHDLTTIAAQQQDHEVYVWTINEPEEINKYLHSSVSGIITDHPDIAKEEQKHLLEESTPVERVLDAINVSVKK